MLIEYCSIISLLQEGNCTWSLHTALFAKKNQASGRFGTAVAVSKRKESVAAAAAAAAATLVSNSHVSRWMEKLS